MPDDLDLALRVRADVAQAQQQLSALRASIQKSTEDVARANGRQASAAETAARATRTLTQTQQQAAQEGTEAARAAVEKARADSAAAAGALRAARAETQAAQAKARAARTAQQLAQSLDTQTAAQTRANTATAQGVQRTRQLGPAIQNTAFQVGDFAVQVASGTSGLRAFTQQVPQLLGGFGVIGAVLGALVAVGAALVPVFLNLGDAAQDSADATDRLAEAADRLRALERARLDVDALAEAYGRASAQARALNAAQDALANRLAARALAEEIAGFDDILGAANQLDYSRANSGLFDLARRLRDIIGSVDPTEFLRPNSEASTRLREEIAKLVEDADLTALNISFVKNEARLLRQELTSLAKLSDEVFEARATGTGAAPEIAENLGLTEEAARRLIVAYGELRDAEGFTAQATALGTLREELVEVRAETADQSEQQRKEVDGFIARILEAEQSTLQLVAASGDVAPGLDNATAAAGRLADELGRAGQSLATLQARAESRIRRAQIRIDFADNPEERTRRLRIEAQDEAEREALVPRLPALRAVGLSTTEINLVTRELREKAGAAFDAQQAAQALEDQLRDLGRTGSGAGRAASREIERLAEAQRKAAQEARALETATQDALRAYSADALEARDEVANAWVDGFRGLEDALVGFVTTGKLNFSDLVNSILADLARIAIRRNITGPIADALGNALGGGGGGGVFGVFGGGGGAAASSAVTLPTFRPFHSGGVPTGPDTPGLAPGEVPALLMRGEAVITSAQSRALLGIDRAVQDRDRAMTILRAAARYHTGGVAGLPGGNTIPEAAGGGVTGSAPPMNVSVEINNAGTPQRVENAGARVDVRGFVVSLFLDDLAAGGPIARGIQNIVPGTRL